MIKLKDLILMPIIFLTESNSGYADYSYYKQLKEEIYNNWMLLLNDITNKNIKICDLEKKELKRLLDVGNVFSVKLHDTETSGEVLVKINVLLAMLNNNNASIKIQGSALNIHSNPLQIYLKIHNTSTINDILLNKQYIDDLASHEAVHIIKFYQKMFQFSSPREVNIKDKNWIYKYYTHPSEIHAYIAQLNNELKHIKEKNTNINFHDALMSSKIWKRYKRDIFWKNPKIKNKMLSKIINFWNKM